MIDSRGRAVRRSMRRAIRAGSPDARASFLRSSPGHIASARVWTSTAAAARRRGNLSERSMSLSSSCSPPPTVGVRKRATIGWSAEADLNQT